MIINLFMITIAEYQNTFLYLFFIWSQDLY